MPESILKQAKILIVDDERANGRYRSSFKKAWSVSEALTEIEK